MTTAKRKANDTMKHKIGFELFAPRLEFVNLLGEWNKWKPIPMERHDDGVWRVEVDLADGDYIYQFQLKPKSDDSQAKTIAVPDPTAIEFGKRADTDDCSTLRVRNGKRANTNYKWQHDDKPLPPNEQLVIYEMHIGDFRGGPGDTDDTEGTFERIIEKLDYLVELGINAIELMPINETASNNYWGYSQRSIYAVENTYGSPDDFCRLIDECHGRGIRVIHDAVFNHVDADAALAKIDYTYWFYKENPDGKELDFGPKFNYEFYDDTLNVWPARQHVISAINLWISIFHLDGVRLDSTRAIKHYDLLKWFNNEMHRDAADKPFITIAEHLPQDPAITGVEGPLDAAWHDNFYRQMIVTTLGVRDENHEPFVIDEVLRILDARKDGFDSPYNTVNYLNNHDLERVMYLLGAQGHIFDDAAFRRNKLGASLLMTTAGIPMLWMGEEFGQATQKSDNRQPLHWSLLNNDRNKDLWEHYHFLIHLRQMNPALYSDQFEVITDMSDRGVVAFKRWIESGNIVVVVANLKPEYAGKVEIASAGIDNGRWREAIYDYEVLVQRNCLSDTLAESEVIIYIKC
jgi:1,4-alpha-glucan branching enzyme